MTRNKYLLPFILVTFLFLFWGFMLNLDPILIPHLRKAFQLSYLQSFRPPILGKIADASGIQFGYIIPLICFLIVDWYGFSGSKVIVSDSVKASLL